MKKFRILSLIFFLNSLVFSQIDREDKIIISEIIKTEIINNCKNAIVKDLDKGIVENNLKPLFKNRTFRIRVNEIDENILLTRSEINYILKSIRNQYSFKWKKEDFPENNLIYSKQVLEYLKKDKENTILSISKPIYLRNKELFVIYNLNLCCGEIVGNVHLGFYKKANGVWKKWIQISQGSF